MAGHDERLDEVARLVLGLSQGPNEQTSSSKEKLKKLLQELPLFYSGMPPALPVFGEALPGPPPSERTQKGEHLNQDAESLGDLDKTSSKEGTPDLNLSRKLRECERKYQKKVHEAEELRGKLQKQERLRKEAEKARGEALEQAAHLKRKLEELEEARELLEAEFERTQHELAKLQGELKNLRLERESLLNQSEGYEQRLAQLAGKIEDLEKELEDKRHIETRLARLTQLRQALPEPFPQELLLRVLVLDYPRFGSDPQDRLMALIDGYRALLAGEEHPALKQSNLDLLTGEPEGIVLLGLERLLLDLVQLPLRRWLRTHGFRLEAFLQQEWSLASPRLSEEQ